MAATVAASVLRAPAGVGLRGSMPARRVPQNTPNGVKAFLTEDLNEARDALSLYLFQDLEAMKGPTPPGVGR